jgi:uncharacterized damage-inducible protein DinB
MDDWARRTREARLARLARTADELGAAVRGQDAATLARRPDAKNWAPIEVLCHLRDAEESFLDRLRQIMATDEPRFPSINPNRVAEEREYLRQQSGDALAAFRRHREGSLAFFGALRETEWSRAGHQKDSRGRRTLDDFLSVMAWHDENHLAQLARSLRGEP